MDAIDSIFRRNSSCALAEDEVIAGCNLVSVDVPLAESNLKASCVGGAADLKLLVPVDHFYISFCLNRDSEVFYARDNDWAA